MLIKKELEVVIMKKLILWFLLATFSLNTVGCSNNANSLTDKSNCINKAWYKKTMSCNHLKNIK